MAMTSASARRSRRRLGPPGAACAMCFPWKVSRLPASSSSEVKAMAPAATAQHRTLRSRGRTAAGRGARRGQRQQACQQQSDSATCSAAVPSGLPWLLPRSPVRHPRHRLAEQVDDGHQSGAVQRPAQRLRRGASGGEEVMRLGGERVLRRLCTHSQPSQACLPACHYSPGPPAPAQTRCRRGRAARSASHSRRHCRHCHRTRHHWRQRRHWRRRRGGGSRRGRGW